ncbi:YkvA family protein [Pontibacter sp. SGAir0037]|uniref:YkvA family protein n=1 Tax=Pontibacter sp. SGAir0037 TaxID=2571030 RepID=UPI0010CD47FF|nr:YkvA family protein [Pontibacter sp. SGAir0037]QCR21298.1 DUF1232 domain-containing protein [Pontibacter sp. SGAir0037]
MLQELINKGLRYSQNAAFKKYVGRAGGVIAKPLKLAMLLSTAYNKMVDIDSTKTGFQQVKDIMQTFIRLVKAYANGSYRNVSNKSLLIGVAVLLYLVTPLDIIPDFIPVVGLIDDISIMAWFIDAFQKEISAFQEWELNQAIEPTMGTL